MRVAKGGEALVRGGEIRNASDQYCSVGIYAAYDGSLKLDDVKISNCKKGVYASDGGKCEATNLTFTNVDDEWRIADDAGTVTHNGRRMTNAD